MKDKQNDIKLNRKLNPLNVWSLALGSIIGWGAFVMPGSTFLPKAATLGTLIGIGLAAVIMIIIAMNYGFMIQKYPVAGGEYTYTKNTFGKKNAYICGWFLGLSYLAIVPMNATALGLVSRKLLNGLLEFGYLYSLAGWDVYLGEVLFASFVLILFAVMSIRGVKVAGNAQTAIALALVAAVVILCVAAVLSPETSVENLKPAFPEGSGKVAGIIAVLAVAPWAFVGFDSIPQAAEEFNFSTQKSRRIMIIAILFGAFVYVAMNTITASAMPWQELLDAGYDWPVGESVEIIMGKVGLIFLGIAVSCAILSGIIGFYMATSRLLFSMSREGALPEWFGKVDPKTHTPKNAILFVMIVSLICPWFGREVLGWIVDMSSIGAAIGYGYTSFAAYRTLKQTGENNPLIKVTGLMGGICGIIFVSLLVVPGMPSFFSVPSWICFITWTVMGLIFYLATAKKKNAL